jgi:hypothetical protein
MSSIKNSTKKSKIRRTKELLAPFFVLGGPAELPAAERVGDEDEGGSRVGEGMC